MLGADTLQVSLPGLALMLLILILLTVGNFDAQNDYEQDQDQEHEFQSHSSLTKSSNVWRRRMREKVSPCTSASAGSGREL